MSMKLPKPGDPAPNKQWDASNPTYSAMVDNCRRAALTLNPMSAQLSDQDVLNAYAYSYGFDDTDAVFDEVILSMIGDGVPQDDRSPTIPEPVVHDKPVDYDEQLLRMQNQTARVWVMNMNQSGIVGVHISLLGAMANASVLTDDKATFTLVGETWISIVVDDKPAGTIILMAMQP
jgi:hypothetical protein